MSPFHFQTTPIPPITREHHRAQISRLTSKMRPSGLLRPEWLYTESPQYGAAEALRVLDFIVYEALETTVAGNYQEFNTLSTHLFAACLERLLHFEWRLIELSSDPHPALCHLETKYCVPIDALIAYRLSKLPLEDRFENLFFDIYCYAGRVWPDGQHFLTDSGLLAPDKFTAIWGFTVPEELRTRFNRLSVQDEHLAIRRIGLTAYDWIGEKQEPEWPDIARQIQQTERYFDETFGQKWKHR